MAKPNKLQLVTGEGFADGPDGKESTCNAEDLDLIPGLGRSPGEGHGSPLQYSCLENPHGQRSLVSYSPWGCKGLDTSGRRSVAHSTVIAESYHKLTPGPTKGGRHSIIRSDLSTCFTSQHRLASCARLPSIPPNRARTTPHI